MVEWSLYEVRLRRSSAECFGARHPETLVTVHEWNSFQDVRLDHIVKTLKRTDVIIYVESPVLKASYIEGRDVPGTLRRPCWGFWRMNEVLEYVETVAFVRFS